MGKGFYGLYARDRMLWMEGMENRFHRCAQKAGLKHIPQIWDRIVDAYQGEGRHYHTLDHISMGLDTFDLLMEFYGTENCALELALWLHDFIYKPEEGGNEEKSADWIYNELTESDGQAKRIARKVRELIMITDHQPFLFVHASAIESSIMLDCDLSIFGQPWDIYERYTVGVRREYSFVPDDVWKVERPKVLERIRERGIFRTGFMQVAGEHTAQTNIERELAQY